MTVSIDDVLNDLAAEYERLDTILSGLSEADWASASGAPGWSVRDVVVHLAHTTEGVAHTLLTPSDGWTVRDRPLDDVVDDQVRADQSGAGDVLLRWRAASLASLFALRRADPSLKVRWAAAPLLPRTLATTRLAEHWAHALDICEPLGLALPDTSRLRHIAWLGHSTLPYAMRLAGLAPVDVYCALTSPDGGLWTFGPPDAAASIRGSAGAFCRVGARRLSAVDSGLVATGPSASDALVVLRNYAA
jgi:uncharacterized protein (TIGR03084 family)